MIKYRQSHFHHSVGEFGMDIKTSMCWQHNHAGYQYHGEPSETDDCSHPPPKMATAENSTLCKTTFDHIIRHGSLRFWPASRYWIYLTCLIIIAGHRAPEQPYGACPRIFRREADGSIKRGD